MFRQASKISKNGVVVEIGSFKGRSTVFLGLGVKKTPGILIFSIDPHIGSPEKSLEYSKIDTLPEFKENIKKFSLENRVVSIRETSSKAFLDFSRLIDLLFIDGSHLYPDVKKDLKNWTKKIKKGGMVVLHDATSLPGPWQAAKERIFFSESLEKIGLCGSMIFATYNPKKTFLEKIVCRSLNFFSYLFIAFYVRIRKIRDDFKN